MAMIHSLERTPATQIAVPTSRVQAMISTHQQDSLTGIIEVEWAPDARILLLLVDGTIPGAYLLTEETCEKVSPAELANLVPTEKVTVRTLVLPPEGVHAVRSLLEWYPPAEEMAAETSTIESWLKTWGARAAAGAVHITWPDAEGFITLSGGSPPKQVVFVTAQRVESGTDGLAAIYAHTTGACTLARYAPPADAATPQEEVPLLHAAFASLVDKAVQRYTELVGSRLAESLMFDLNDQAYANEWNIRITSAGVTDTHTFEMPDTAAYVYRSLLNELVVHTSAVIGKRLVSKLFLEAASQLGSDAQEAVQTYSVIPATVMP